MEQKRHAKAHEVIRLLKSGTTVRVAPKGSGEIAFIGVYGKAADRWDVFYPSSITRQLTNLHRIRQIALVAMGEETVATVANSLRQKLSRYDLADVSIPRPKRWDHKWRMVFFDIGDSPDTERIRFKLRYTLKKMGFVMFQKSVYLFPYPCREEVMRVLGVLRIPGSVRFAVVSELDDDRDLRQRFGLPVTALPPAAVRPKRPRKKRTLLYI